MTAAVESWDDDMDFQGDLFAHSVSTVQTSLSSRLSVNSESNIGEEDWQVQVTPNDDNSTSHAIQSAKRAGVPIPSNVPASALMGGSIKRLGKKNSRQKLDDGWGDDLDIPMAGGLTLKPRKAEPPPTIQDDEEHDDFDEFEGSLGIRFAGTNKQRNRSTSTSAMSPSLGSQTAESDDDFNGLELPGGDVDLQGLLRKRQAAEAAKVSESVTPIEQPKALITPKSPGFLQESDNFFDDLEVGGGDVFDPKKLTLHKNIKQKPSRTNLSTPARAPTTTLTFTDRPAATRIPRPVPSAKPNQSRLETVMEPGATQQPLRLRLQPTTTSAQLLRSKRSMPVMKSNYSLSNKPSIPFLPAGSSVQSHHVAAKPSHLRRDSDPHRGASPPPRSLSRLSNAYVPDTPSRSSRRLDFAPKDLLREAAAKRTLTRPAKKKVFGDGSELEVFDDLPTSVTKESKFLKQPSTRTAPKTLRNIPSRLDLREHGTGARSALTDRMSTPLPGPQTPRSPLKIFQENSNTPRYLRDTAASRIARESRLANAPRPRSEGPNMPVSNKWQAQIVSRSPHTSPSAARNKGRRVQPSLIKPGDTNIVKSEKGMTFNPRTHCWEGNDIALHAFEFPAPLPTPTPLTHHRSYSYLGHHDHPAPVPSPPRPALIAPMSANSTQNIQVVGGMVFDPIRMCWLKVKNDQTHRTPSAKASPQIDEDDEDPFAGIDDLKDSGPSGPPAGAGASVNASQGGGLANEEWLVGEEFDLGPEFIRRQKEEEIAWRRRCESWFVGFDGGPRAETSHWRWRIREIAGVPR
ncbi:Protein byr4 [Sphaceloma murrayae]|uniref:Protein byr4 n=1 Tax=Sphaceloma murrayae TaxID=2082308 RepID=A0A2K1QI51_9PEZI|nr:Protein byr4 [Sphaceloma murrayae]